MLPILLIVGLIIGFGAGSAGRVVTTVTQTTQIPTTLFETKTITATIIETIAVTRTLRETAVSTSVFTSTVTTYPRYSPTCRVNEPCGDGGAVFIIHQINKRDRISVWSPSEGNVFLIIEVSIQNLRNEEIGYNVIFSKVKDARGFEYLANLLATSALTGGFGSGKLKPGENVRGYIAFEIPQGAEGLVFEYEDPLEDIRVDIQL